MGLGEVDAPEDTVATCGRAHRQPDVSSLAAAAVAAPAAACIPARGSAAQRVSDVASVQRAGGGCCRCRRPPVRMRYWRGAPLLRLILVSLCAHPPTACMSKQQPEGLRSASGKCDGGRVAPRRGPRSSPASASPLCFPRGPPHPRAADAQAAVGARGRGGAGRPGNDAKQVCVDPHHPMWAFTAPLPPPVPALTTAAAAYAPAFVSRYLPVKAAAAPSRGGLGGVNGGGEGGRRLPCRQRRRGERHDGALRRVPPPAPSASAKKKIHRKSKGGVDPIATSVTCPPPALVAWIRHASPRCKDPRRTPRKGARVSTAAPRWRRALCPLGP